MNNGFSEIPDPGGSLDPAERLTARRNPRGARRLRSSVVLTLFVLVGMLAAVLVLASARLSAHASGGAPTPTPTLAGSTATPVATLPYGSLYLATPGSLDRLELHSNKVAWSISASQPATLLVSGQTLFYANLDPANSYLAAVNAQTGTQFWRNSQYPPGFLLASGNELYDSYCNLSAASDPCHLDGINAHTGALIWSFDLPNGNAWIALQHNILYGVSYSSYFALNATTGALLWQQTLTNYQQANMTPAVNGQVLAFASCDTTKQTPGYGTCDLTAVNATTGALLWQQAATNVITATPSISQGVIYSGDASGNLEALDAQNGKLLWSVNAGALIDQVQALAGTIYVETTSANVLTRYQSGGGGPAFFLGAYGAATHTLLWSLPATVGQTSNTTVPLAYHQAHSGGPLAFPFVLDHGLLYLPNGSATAIAVLKGSTGGLVTDYGVPGGTALSGFTVVAV